MNKICLISFILTVSFCILEIPVEINQELKPIKQYLKSFLPQKQNQNPQQVLEQYGRFTYFCGKIGVGTPKQEIDVQFDITTSLTWMISSKCKTVQCNKWNSYNSQKSLTYKPGSGSVYTQGGQGVLANDTISLAGKSIYNFQFGQVPQSYYHISGVIGLGMNNEFMHNDQILLQGYNQGQWDDLSFSLYLQNGRAAPQSHIVLGGINPNFAKSEFSYFPLLIKNQWKIKLDSLKIKDKNTQIKLGNGYFDSTRDSILTPVQVYDQLVEQMGLTQSYRLTNQEVQNLPTVEFIIGGQTFPLESQYYTQCDESNFCSLQFERQQVDSITFGIAFMRKYYTHYDEGKKRIGISEGVTIL